MTIMPGPKNMDDFEEEGRKRSAIEQGTPRTDAVLDVSSWTVSADFARQLERELAETLAKYERLQQSAVGWQEQLAQRSSTTSAQEFCWLIERQENRAFWWTGVLHPEGFWRWTSNAHEAARFPTKEAAETVRLRLKLYYDYPDSDLSFRQCESVEHGFVYALPSTVERGHCAKCGIGPKRETCAYPEACEHPGLELALERNQLLLRLSQVQAALKDANEICRSAHAIAERITVQFSTEEFGTAFGAFQDRCRDSLERQHRVMHPEQCETPSAIVPQSELLSVLRELADLMDDTVSGNYKPDGFTTQPARSLLRIADGRADD